MRELLAIVAFLCIVGSIVLVASLAWHGGAAIIGLAA